MGFSINFKLGECGTFSKFLVVEITCSMQTRSRAIAELRAQVIAEVLRTEIFDGFHTKMHQGFRGSKFLFRTYSIKNNHRACVPQACFVTSR